MLGIAFFKGQPTDYVIEYVGGRVVRQGMGQSFYYWALNTQVAVIPTSTRDASFVFNELTNNFQSVTLQGQFTYRIADPVQAAGQLNFAWDTRRQSYLAKDPDSLPARIANIVQMETRREIQRRTLEETLRQSQEIAAVTLGRIRTDALLAPLGVEVTALYFLSAKPTPEVAKALEAQYRETLLRQADQAIYARRGAAVAEERKIKENERATEIALEEQRRSLIALEGDNARLEAENKGQALETLAEFEARATERRLAVYKNMDPRSVLALALKEMGENTQKIGSLNITTETLGSLLSAPSSAGTGD
jgi:regulator of protease activity HflC (stomatin/prohibitin superfamily)